MPKDCSECVKQNLPKKSQSRKSGLCMKHYNQIHDEKITTYVPKDCSECVRLKLKNIAQVQKDGLCMKHYSKSIGKTHPCRVCIDTYVDPPNETTKGYCDDHKGKRHIPKCVKCIELKKEKPYSVVNNDLCIEHGAEEPKCKECKRLKISKPKKAIKYSLCSEHIDLEKKKCIVCVKKGINPPKDARSGQKICIQHGADKK